jgi:predicted MFS family arabinose efflux permease
VLPLSNSLIYDTVGGDRLLNAMAARLTAFNLARIGGSALAGALIETVGVGACFLVVGSVNLVAPTTLLFMRGGRHSPGRSEPALRTAVEGLTYAWRSRPLRSLLTMSLLLEMFGFSHFVMLPVIARDVLGVGASGLGYLSAAGGAGSLVGTVGIASLGDFRRKGLLLGLAAGGAGLSLVLFATSSWYPLSLLLAALAGGTLMAYDPTMATVLQVLSTDAMRGRIMGLYALTFGFTPLGGFAAGIVATLLSTPIAIGLSGGAILAYVLPNFGRLARLQEGSEPAVPAAPRQD